MRIAKCRVGVLARLVPYKRFILSQYLAGKHQTEIAKLMDIAQPSVADTINRTLDRCVTLSCHLPRPSMAMVKKATRNLPEQDQEILLLMFQHEQQLAVAEEIGRSQGYVRYRYLKGLDNMEEGRVQDWMLMVKQLKWEERSQFFAGRLPFSIPSGKALLAQAEMLLQTPYKSRTRST